MEDQLFQMLVQKDELTWQTIIHELVKTEQLDPWNINISVLTQKYLDTIRTLKEHNFFISGKVLLASAILLRIKSVKLIDEHIAQFDQQLFPQQENIFEESDDPVKEHIHYEVPQLLIKTPQPRKRQLTLNDLMKALEKALEVDERRAKRLQEFFISEAVIPEKKYDISELIQQVFDKIKRWFSTEQQLTFLQLVGSDDKHQKIFTFIPLLHLDAQQKVELLQQQNFGEIQIKYPVPKEEPV